MALALADLYAPPPPLTADPAAWPRPGDLVRVSPGAWLPGDAEADAGGEPDETARPRFARVTRLDTTVAFARDDATVRLTLAPAAPPAGDGSAYPALADYARRALARVTNRLEADMAAHYYTNTGTASFGWRACEATAAATATWPAATTAAVAIDWAADAAPSWAGISTTATTGEAYTTAYRSTFARSTAAITARLRLATADLATTLGWAAGFTTGVSWDDGVPARPTPEQRLRAMIRDRAAPAVRRHAPVNRPGLGGATDFRELRARETLARVVGADKYRRFQRDGFVSVRGKSGRTYQIFPGSGFTRVYEKGVEIDRLCVVLNGRFPPTDSVVVRFLMILNDEARFERLAVRHGPLPVRPAPARAADARPLADIYRDLRAG